jgi:hypothetical protein
MELTYGKKNAIVFPLFNPYVTPHMHFLVIHHQKKYFALGFPSDTLMQMLSILD